MIKAMDAVGVDGALLVSVYTMYRWDASYAVAVQKAHPDRFGVIKPVNANDPKVADTIAEWAAMPRHGRHPHHDDAARSRPTRPIPASTASSPRRPSTTCRSTCWRAAGSEQLGQLAKRNPDTQIVLDHLGLEQPMMPPAPSEPWHELPQVLKLAENKNIAIKISGACTLSHEKFPYKDIWDPLGRIFDAFGLDRCMWGTDWTRAVNLLTYKEGVDSFRVTDRLSDSDRATLMGGSLQKIYGWSPKKA